MLMDMTTFFILLIQTFFVLNLTIMLGSLCTWIERKASALLQDRVGANRAGAYVDFDSLPFQPLVKVLKWTGMLYVIRVLGLLGVVNTLLCDGAKGILKEDFVPDGTSNFLHSLGPFMAVFPIFLAFALVPLAPDFVLFDGRIVRPQLAPLNAGVLFILAMGSLAVYGVMIAGWTGNNKFSLLGALRASAQMISYELSMGLVFVTMVIVYGTLDLYTMVEYQVAHGWGIISHITAPLTFVLLFIVGMAETKRAPFDLPESESELVAGYFTEYSGMKFLLFWLGEFAEIALFSLLISLLFFGGWNLPWVSLPEGTFLTSVIGFFVLMTKVVFFCTLQIVIRWTLPRFRYDQLMNLGWKMLLPISIVNLLVVAAWKIATEG
jgi:NADH-quinone oxidoreductase subunit H